MSPYFDILITFFKLGLVSFGGGYAMIPLIQTEIVKHHWLDISTFTNLIALSAMAPGPIASNTATIVGFDVASLLGAVDACVAVTLPSLLLILIVGKLFFKFQEHPYVKAAFYGLRPTIIGVIAFAAIKFAISNGIIGGNGFIDLKSSILMTIAFIILIRTKLHPAYLILVSGLIGIVLF